MKNSIVCRLYVIMARDGRTALIFRRGPRNNMLLVRWWLKEDRFEEGEWIKHKCYVRRCDVSPDGEFLLYFAAHFVEPLYSWTAISRPPYFTALALWPKRDAWGGGGLMIDKYKIGLNHKLEDMLHSADLSPHPKYRVVPLGEYSGHGEDYPVENARMLRDGWTEESHGEVHFDWKLKTEQFYTLDPPAVMSMRSPRFKSIKLSRIHTGGIVQQGKHYVERYVLSDMSGKDLRTFDMFDWAGWNKNGDLLLANDGKIWRLPAQKAKETALNPFVECQLLTDLSDRKFDPKPAPFWATTWQPRK